MYVCTRHSHVRRINLFLLIQQMYKKKKKKLTKIHAFFIGEAVSMSSKSAFNVVLKGRHVLCTYTVNQRKEVHNIHSCVSQENMRLLLFHLVLGNAGKESIS